ncbi:MAG: HU family DNA-binding protein [Phycisphaerales bacterium]|nr:HU family DNA-binding protein [Phycisphaerales bacterium]
MAKAAKKAAKPAAAKSVTKARTKSEIYAHLAETAGLTRKQVAGVFDEMAGLIRKDLGKGPGVFTVPGLMKITVQKRPAVKAHTKPDPFHPGEMMQVKAKPARKVVKVRPLKNLKEMV